MRETAGPRRYVEEKIKENENATRGGGGGGKRGEKLTLSCLARKFFRLSL